MKKFVRITAGTLFYNKTNEENFQNNSRDTFFDNKTNEDIFQNKSRYTFF